MYGPTLTPAPFLPLSKEVLPVGVIAGATVGAGILLIFFFAALVFFLYRRRKGSEYKSCTATVLHTETPFEGTAGGGAGSTQSAERHLPAPGRKDVTLRKLDIKVETVNREPLTMHSDREDDSASVSTATRVMKAIYSVRTLLLPSQHSLHAPKASPTISNFCHFFTQ